MVVWWCQFGTVLRMVQKTFTQSQQLLPLFAGWCGIKHHCVVTHSKNVQDSSLWSHTPEWRIPENRSHDFTGNVQYWTCFTKGNMHDVIPQTVSLSLVWSCATRYHLPSWCKPEIATVIKMCRELQTSGFALLVLMLRNQPRADFARATPFHSSAHIYFTNIQLQWQLSCLQWCYSHFQHWHACMVTEFLL